MGRRLLLHPTRGAVPGRGRSTVSKRSVLGYFCPHNLRLSRYAYSRSASILLAHLHAAPRFVSRYIQQAHYPLDRDIVREAWVSGDLKEQLGIAHRRDLKKRSRGGDLEGRPFNSHSTSNLQVGGDDRGAYAPAALSSPAGFTKELPHQQPHEEFDMKVIRPSTDAHHDAYQDGGYPLNVRHDQGHSRIQPSAMSYYSASDIPMSSPVRAANRRLGSDPDGPSPAASPLATSYSPSQQQYATGYDHSPTQPSFGAPGQHIHQLQPSPSSPSGQRHPGFSPSPIGGATSIPSRASPSPLGSGRPQLSPHQTGSGGPPSSWRPDETGRSHSRVSSHVSREGSFVTADDHWEEEEDDARTVREGTNPKRDSASTFQGGYAM